MSQPRLLRGFALAALFVAVPLAAHADDVVHQNKAFKVMAPESWVMDTFREEKGGKLGSWVLASPSRNRKLYVHVTKSNPRKSLKQIFNDYVGTNLRKRVRHLRIQSYEEKTLKGGKVAIAFVYGATRRNKNAHVAKFGVFIARRNGGERVLAASLGGTKEGWGATALRFETILGSIDLK